MLHTQYHNKQWIKGTPIKRALVLWHTVAATESKYNNAEQHLSDLAPYYTHWSYLI